jgi:hypothetical protein
MSDPSCGHHADALVRPSRFPRCFGGPKSNRPPGPLREARSSRIIHELGPGVATTSRSQVALDGAKWRRPSHRSVPSAWTRTSASTRGSRCLDPAPWRTPPTDRARKHDEGLPVAGWPAFLSGGGSLAVDADRYLADESYRRRIARQLNKGENLHALRRELAYVGEGAGPAPALRAVTEQMWVPDAGHHRDRHLDHRVLRPRSHRDAPGRPTR